MAKHGHFLPPDMQGLTEDQIEELKLHDKFEKISIPQGGSVECEDPIGRRSGKGGSQVALFDITAWSHQLFTSGICLRLCAKFHCQPSVNARRGK